MTAVLEELGLQDPDWLAFAATDPKAHPFHHPAWATVLAKTYGFRSFVLALREGDRITAGMPMLEVKRPLGKSRWTCLPFTDMCAPLHDETNETTLVGEAAKAALAAGTSALEIRARIDAPGAQQRLVAVQHNLALHSDPDAIYASFHNSQVRANIRRSERASLRIRRAESMSELSVTFYDLHTRARRRQGIPVQPRAFFENLWTTMLAQGLGFCLLVEAGSTPIAGAVFLTWNGTATYKYGASDPAHLSLRPNHFLFWQAIQWACHNGYHTFDFGRTDLAHDSLRAFKSGWGTVEEALYYSAFGSDPGGAPSSRALATMSAVIRHSPLWVTRALGDLLYRFTA